MYRRFAMMLPLAVLAFAAASPVHAQGFGGPVVIAAPATFPRPTGRAVIYRFPQQLTDVIVLRASDGTADDLRVALVALRQLRKASPRTKQDQVTVVAGYLPLADAGPGVKAALAKRLSELQNQPVAQVGNLGPGRWIQLPDATP